ncbi:hydroxysteroid 11-beta-dehydrogenase 1-like protein [Diadema antillarum]|uniref:hydroxysteroid 11-beta-dehydrogenase 1-like protein n=1 Tax=Diadema antillarum TaxID=105358 RepID=UPI003A8B927B
MPSFKLVAVLAFGAALLGYILRDPFDEETIRGKRVIVTGASTGIGEQLAYWYSRLGARVLITARRETVLEQVGLCELNIQGFMIGRHFPLPLMQPYSASKFALHGFFGALRHDFAFHGYDISITDHILGSINTSNALAFSKVAFNPEVFDTPAEDTAYRIMKGTAMRERTVYFPYYVRITMLRDLFPSLLDIMVRSWVREGAIDKLKTSPNS